VFREIVMKHSVNDFKRYKRKNGRKEGGKREERRKGIREEGEKDIRRE
jgi:hypothetical protein